MVLSALITDFLAYLKTERKTSLLTIKNYSHYLNRFLSFSGDISPEKINLKLIGKYKLYLSCWIDPNTKRGLKKITQNFFLIALRSFLKYLAEIAVISLSPEKVKLTETDPRPLKILDDFHLRQLLKAPDVTLKNGIRDMAILQTLFSTGLRVSELALLNRDLINLEGKRFKVVGKGGKERMVFISDAAADWILKYLRFRKDTFKPLFIRFQGKVEVENNGESMRLTTRSIERIVEKYVKQLGFPIKATPQTLRHNFATGLLTNGADMKSVQKMLGHDNMSSTQIYTQLASSSLVGNK